MFKMKRKKTHSSPLALFVVSDSSPHISQVKGMGSDIMVVRFSVTRLILALPVVLVKTLETSLLFFTTVTSSNLMIVNKYIYIF
jgi:hypothetical protein